MALAVLSHQGAASAALACRNRLPAPRFIALRHVPLHGSGTRCFQQAARASQAAAEQERARQPSEGCGKYRARPLWDRPNLFPVDLVLHRAATDQAVHHHVPQLQCGQRRAVMTNPQQCACTVETQDCMPTPHATPHAPHAEGLPAGAAAGTWHSDLDAGAGAAPASLAWNSAEAPLHCAPGRCGRPGPLLGCPWTGSRPGLHRPPKQ
jgi:hypothetical protein